MCKKNSIRIAALLLILSVPGYQLFGQNTAQYETAVFAGGCFWGVEAVFTYLVGVQEAVSGYAGGQASTANYNSVSRGLTSHAESVLVSYDPDKISYDQLLAVFFNVAHDPTQLNYQGPDHGSQYRSAIFYQSETQRQKAQAFIDNLSRSRIFRAPIVTELNALEKFFPAETYHQDFMRKNPNQAYVSYWDWPKIDHLRELYPQLFVDARWR